LIRTVEFCKQHPLSDLDEAGQSQLMQMAASILKDRDYAYWVNSFIPDEHEPAYWDASDPGSHDAQAQALRNFLGNAYEQPERQLAQVFLWVHMRYQEGQTICKKFLVMLAAISHTLLRINAVQRLTIRRRRLRSAMRRRTILRWTRKFAEF
jgi:hypothetical protein